MSIVLDQGEERDAVLVCAEEPLRGSLSELARARGYQARVAVTPLDAIETLQDSRVRIRHALISLTQDWGRALREFLTDEYPHVACVMLGA